MVGRDHARCRYPTLRYSLALDHQGGREIADRTNAKQRAPSGARKFVTVEEVYNVKKIGLMEYVCLFLGLLLAGAAYRTSVKLADSGQEQNRGNASNNQSNSEAIIQPANEYENQPIQEKSEIDGQVMGLSNRGISVQLSNGQLLEISGRAWRYAQEFGFTAQNGDVLWLEGYFENGTFEVMQMTNLGMP